MSDTASSHLQRLETPPKQLVSDIDSQIPENQPNPYSHFLYKSVLLAVFVVLPLFPSQAPDFFSKTLLTRGWELVLFVGIAVSYGLFSRLNIETEKENESKLDNTQTYVSRILQVSSLFDDEFESPSGFEDNKIQTWNSHYSRAEPVVVIAKENSVIDEQSSSSGNTGNKPLLLPVRSLKSRVSDPDAVETINEPGGSLGFLSRSSSGIKMSSSNSFKKSRNEETGGGLDPLALEEKLNESVVLPSPIPWRSRSGRMEMKEEVGVASPPVFSLPPSVDESEFHRLESQPVRSPVPWSSRPNSASPSPKKLSPSPSLSPEMRPKKVEDLGRKKSFHKSSPPPPPPPPPPFSIKSPLSVSKTTPITGVNRNFQSDLKNFNRNKGEDVWSRRDSGVDSFEPEAEFRTQTEGSSMGKSVLTNRASKPGVETKKVGEIGGIRMEEKAGKRDMGAEAVLMERKGSKAVGFDQALINTEISSHSMPKPPFSKYHKEEKKELLGKDIVVSEDDSDSEADDIEENLDTKETTSNAVSDAGTDPFEVDKKADEFIAKFREQIRLQRIESIKRSTGQQRINRNSSS